MMHNINTPKYHQKHNQENHLIKKVYVDNNTFYSQDGGKNTNLSFNNIDIHKEKYNNSPNQHSNS